jgi:hypothetical protein
LVALQVFSVRPVADSVKIEQLDVEYKATSKASPQSELAFAALT